MKERNTNINTAKDIHIDSERHIDSDNRYKNIHKAIDRYLDKCIYGDSKDIHRKNNKTLFQNNCLLSF